jgi:hypothetical protein
MKAVPDASISKPENPPNPMPPPDRVKTESGCT